MLEFYRAVQKRNQNEQNIVITVLDGSFRGEKILVSNQKVVWTSAENGFAAHYLTEVVKLCETGMVTVGESMIFCESLGQEKKIVICGGGHISIPIIQMGIMLGYQVTVLEDRPKFADCARRAGASKVICAPFEEGLSCVEGDLDTYFVIVTRGHRYDQVCLEWIAKKEHAYIGMIGSKKRVAKVKEAVIEKGGDPKVIHGIYSPIGLAIGAEMPEEIAVSIIAEIIQVKQKQKRKGGYEKEIIKAILEETEKKEAKVLVTIISRKGSAPREVGTKMLVLSDGNCIGTIGGGCVEADILRRALFMIQEEHREPERYFIDLTGKDAEEDGMFCGGVIEVLLEWIEG